VARDLDDELQAAFPLAARPGRSQGKLLRIPYQMISSVFTIFGTKAYPW
jgi:hypothetical protein